MAAAMVNYSIVAQLIRDYLSKRGDEKALEELIHAFFISDPDQNNTMLVTLLNQLPGKEERSIAKQVIIATVCDSTPIHCPNLKHNFSLASLINWVMSHKFGFIFLDANCLTFNESQWKVLSETLAQSNLQIVDIQAETLKKFGHTQWKFLGDTLTNSNLTTLSIQKNFDELTPENLLTLGVSLKHTTIFELILAGSFFTLFNKAQWQTFENFLFTSNITVLHLDNMNLTDSNIESLRMLSELLTRSRVTTLHFSQNINKFTPAQWKIFTDLLAHSNLTTLSLAHSNLNTFTPLQWELLENALIISKITSLDLSNNNLHAFSVEEWRKLNNILKKSKITSLTLANNSLCLITDECLSDFENTIIESKITALTLSTNSLGILSPSQWQTYARILRHSNITRIDFSDNSFHFFGPEQWIAFENIFVNSKVTTLGFSSKELHHLTKHQWELFKSLIVKSRITTLNISISGLNMLSPCQWETFCETLAASAITTLDNGDVRSLPIEKQQQINIILMCNAVKARLEQDTFAYVALRERIHLPTPVDEVSLEVYIKNLEKMNSSHGHLITGLLLTGLLVDINLPEDNIKSREKRLQDGITYLTKAAEDPKMFSQVTNILWHIRTIHGEHYPSVRKRLLSIWLMPSFETARLFSKTSFPSALAPLPRFFNLPSDKKNTDKPDCPDNYLIY
ncbi:hypothetical protein [Legionella cardiaca]|uniref:Uncharacterized protein n=1 Tax=Legionella cardiaca TaxID=1071983 RepID=A0ABY8AV63_9GAMM|nr:hypothetical protein [Legionella cardiaca]WED44584.1 hypothetical protein PXX05_07290 [Legionella cardiaca]